MYVGTSCQNDDGDVPSSFDPVFELALEDGTILKNEKEAMNEVKFGSVLKFTNKTQGDFSKVVWTLSSPVLSKEIIAKDGVGEYKVIMSGVYDLTMAVDSSKIVYEKYLSVVGSGKPVPEKVKPNFAIVNEVGDTLTNASEAKHAIVTGQSITLLDKSTANPTSVKWTLECEAAGVKDEVVVSDIPMGQHAKAAYTFKKPGVYNITQEAGGEKLSYKAYFSVKENLFATAKYDCGLEVGDGVGMFKDLWWFGTPTFTLKNTDTKPHFGARSLFMDLPAGKQTAFGYRLNDNLDIKIPVKPGMHTIGFWMFVESKGSVPFKVDCALMGHDERWSGTAEYPITVDTKVNEWIHCTLKVEAKSNTPGVVIFRVIYNQKGQDAPFKAYFDDFTMIAD